MVIIETLPTACRYEKKTLKKSIILLCSGQIQNNIVFFHNFPKCFFPLSASWINLKQQKKPIYIYIYIYKTGNYEIYTECHKNTRLY
jgi:hypothetical protein